MALPNDEELEKFASIVADRLTRQGLTKIKEKNE